MPRFSFLDDNDGVPVPCPRCGYDQQGHMMSWREQCPLHGRCSECGLDFAWAHLLRPEKFPPRWCVEFARSATSIPRCIAATALMSLLPWIFWKRLGMSDELRIGRLAAYAIVLIAPLMVLYAAEQATLALRVRTIVEQRHASSVAYNRQHLAMMQQMQAGARSPMIKQTFDKEIGVVQGFLATPPVKNLTPREGVMEAIFDPFLKRSRGEMFTDPWESYGYPPPRELHAVALGLDPETEFVSSALFGTRGGWRWLAAGLVAFIGIPFGLLLLPISRSLARVRWVHIVRIMLYGMIVPAGILSTILILLTVQYSLGDPNDALLRTIGIVGRWAMLLLVNVWWMIAIHRYLRMPRGWLIAPALTLLSVLLVAGLTYLFMPNLLIDA